MIVKADLVKRIREYFNLNIYETKVWMALLTKGIASAGEVAELSGVPRSRTYDVLESLEKRGFAIVKIGKPVKYISVKPTEVIEKMKANVMREANDKVTSLIGLKETQEYVELEQLHKTGISPLKAHELAGAIRGRSNIISRIREVVENAKKEVLICTSVADFEDKSRVLLPAIEKLNQNSVKVKVALSGDGERIKKLNARLDLKARTISTEARFFVADRKEIVFMTTPENSEEEIGVWLNSEFFTGSLAGMIENSIRK